MSTFPNSLLIGGNIDSQPISFEQETSRENNYFTSAIAPTIINQASSQLVVKKQAKSQTNKKPNKSTKSKKAAKPGTAQLEPINSVNSFANSETPNQASLTVTSKSKNLKSDRTIETSSQQPVSPIANVSQAQDLKSDRTVEPSSQNKQANTAPSIVNISEFQQLRSDRTIETSLQSKQSDTAPPIDNFPQSQELRSDRTLEKSLQNTQANIAPSIDNVSQAQDLRSDRTSDTSFQSKQADTVPPIDNVSHPQDLGSDRTSEPSLQSKQADTAPLIDNFSQAQDLGSDLTSETLLQNTQASTAPSIDNFSQAQDLGSDRTSEPSSQNTQANTSPSIVNVSQAQEMRGDRTSDTSSQNKQADTTSSIDNFSQSQDLGSDRTVETSSQNTQASTAPQPVSPIVNVSQAQDLGSDRTPDISSQQPVSPIVDVDQEREWKSDRTPDISSQNIQAITATQPVSPKAQEMRSDRTIETSSQNKQANTAPPIDNFSQAENLGSDRTIETSSQQPVSPIVNVDQQQEMKSDRTSDISSQNTQASTTQQSVSPEIVMKQSDVRANNYLVVQSPNNITIENTTKIAKESYQTEVEKDSIFDNPLPPKGYAIGGQVTASNSINHQQIAPSDTVPAMLTPGEFVINAKDAQKNLNLLKHINNNGTIPDLSTNNVNAVGTSAQVKTATDSAVPRQSLDTTKIKPLGYLVSSSLGKETANHHLITLSTLQLKTYENQANKQTKNSTHYSSTPLIFRKPVSTANTSFKPNTQSAQWSSSEEFMSSEKITRVSNNFNPDISSDDALRRQQPPAYTKSKVHIDTASNLIQPKSFAKDKEAVVTDKTTITETIERNSSQLNQSSEINSVEFEKLARDVYQLLRRRLENEQERHGILSGRLPW
ncbi:hypothetical protein H6G27_19045 [Nostoc linckia FACHB-104]|nr:hypothetical protein [Nostoc linckia FACHB-104]